MSSEEDLDQALRQAMAEPSARPAFYRRFLEADLFVRGRLDGTAPRPGLVRFSPQDRLLFFHASGNGAIPVFFSREMMQAYYREEVSTLCLKGIALLHRTRRETLLLVAALDYAKLFPQQETEKILACAEPDPVLIKPQERLLVAMPEQYPHTLADALKAAFAVNSAVRAAWLVSAVYEGRPEPPHAVLGVEADGDVGPLLVELTGIAGHFLPKGEMCDIVLVGRDASANVLTSEILRHPPLYIRSRN